MEDATQGRTEDRRKNPVAVGIELRVLCVLVVAHQMQLAKVIGDIVATCKDEKLRGIKLLIVQPLSPDREPRGLPLVAADAVGAGVGEEVFFVRGKEASFPFYPGEPPVDAGIVGIVDRWDVENPSRCR
jgi:ethanolamine utilization protein EutN